MKEKKLIGNVSVFGCDKLGKSILYSLAVKYIGLHCHSYILYGQDFDDEYGTQFVDTVSSIRLKDNIEVVRLKKLVTCMIVTVTGDELIDNLDLLISLDIPLLFCFNDLKENVKLINILKSKENVPAYLTQDVNADVLIGEIILSLEFLEQVNKKTEVA